MASNCNEADYYSNVGVETPAANIAGSLFGRLLLCFCTSDVSHLIKR